MRSLSLDLPSSNRLLVVNVRRSMPDVIEANKDTVHVHPIDSATQIARTMSAFASFTALPLKSRTQTHTICHRHKAHATAARSRQKPSKPPSKPSPPPSPAYKAPKSLQATLFTTGEKVLVHPTQVSTAEDEPRFIICPSCQTAYIGNAITSALPVSCARCSHKFLASPADFYSKVASEQAQDSDATLSKDRIVCKHLKTCPGCTVTGAITKPPILEMLENFLRRCAPRVTLSVEAGHAYHWRTHAKLAIRNVRGVPTLGLFQVHSHDLHPIPECTVHHPAINAAANVVQATLRSSSIRAYDEYSGKGDLRYALLTAERRSGKVQCTLVWNARDWKESAPKSQAFASELWRRAGGNGGMLHSVWYNWNATKSNAIVNPEKYRYYKVYGDEMVVESVMDVDMYFPPYVFRQANLDAFEGMLLPRLMGYIPRGATIAEFCAGVGVIGLVALKERKASHVRMSEINEGAEGAFRLAYKRLKKCGVKGVAEFVAGSDDETLDIVQDDTDVVIVDPPRGGLSEDVVRMLAESGGRLKRVIYVSCGVKSFMRDARMLVEGGWKVIGAHAYILFPGSDQVESVAIFERDMRRRR